MALYPQKIDMSEKELGLLLGVVIAAAIVAVVMLTLPMPPKRRRH